MERRVGGSEVRFHFQAGPIRCCAKIGAMADRDESDKPARDDLTSRPLTLADLRLVLARVSMGEQEASELPLIAAWAPAGGVDSPSLRDLAGHSGVDARECRDLFGAAMEELGVAIPVLSDARRALARCWASEMIAGALTPYEASRLIWRKAWDVDDGPDDLTVFVGLASEWEGTQQGRRQIERQMLEAARGLVGSTTVAE